jgi:hypothetical protein
MNGFTPRNDVERLLADFEAERLEPEDFARKLLDLQVFMPVKDEKRQIAGFQTSTKAEPLVIEDGDGARVAILFTGPERAKAFLQHYPGYSGGLLAEMAWIVRRMGAGMSMALNPGLELGMDFDPDMVAMLAALLPQEDE